MNTNKTPEQVQQLARKVEALSRCLKEIAQLCLDESATQEYLPGILTPLDNAFKQLEKRLKLAKAAANELAISAARPIED